jgi:two-component system KDP operon response regulator KdpE
MAARPQSSWMSGPAGVQPLVLVVEDQSRLGRSLVSTLASHGFRTLRAGTKANALMRAVEYQPDFVLLDVQALQGDAVGVTGRLRDWTAVPIVALLPRERANEGGAVLDAGANDYIVRPFRTTDLLARMRVWLRQSARTRAQRLLGDATAERFRIDGDRRTLVIEGREVHVTPLECKLLLALARSPGKVLTEQQILAAVWGAEGASRSQYLRAHLRQLRQKIERDPDRPRHLVSEAGGGYRLKLG